MGKNWNLMTEATFTNNSNVYQLLNKDKEDNISRIKWRNASVKLLKTKLICNGDNLIPSEQNVITDGFLVNERNLTRISLFHKGLDMSKLLMEPVEIEDFVFV